MGPCQGDYRDWSVVSSCSAKLLHEQPKCHCERDNCMDVKLLSLSLSFCFVLFLAGGLARQAHLKHGLEAGVCILLIWLVSSPILYPCRCFVHPCLDAVCDSGIALQHCKPVPALCSFGCCLWQLSVLTSVVRRCCRHLTQAESPHGS
jgi:hypothetical protein